MCNLFLPLQEVLLLQIYGVFFTRRFVIYFVLFTFISCGSHSRAYVHHLLRAKELLGEVLMYTHNQWQMHRLFQEIRRRRRRMKTNSENEIVSRESTNTSIAVVSEREQQSRESAAGQGQGQDQDSDSNDYDSWITALAEKLG
jgi:queuine tRNA-ribosyltransferase